MNAFTVNLFLFVTIETEICQFLSILKSFVALLIDYKVIY